MKESNKICPHDAVGVVAAQSLGEPGTQMCIDGSERIIIKRNGRIEIWRIDEFTNYGIENFGCKKEGPYEIVEIGEEVYVPVLDADEKVKWNRLISCNRSKAPAKLMLVRTASGRKIFATDFHSFVIRKDNRIVPVAGKMLKVGDRIPALKYLPENCVHSIQTLELLPEHEQGKVNCSAGSVSTKRSLPIPQTFELDEIFGYFIGAYLSEGSLSNSEVSISNTDEGFISKIKTFAQRANLHFKEFKHHRGFAWSNDLRIRSTLLHKLVKNTCGEGSAGKRVPEFAYSANEAFVSGLLRAYFDGDGNITLNRKMIRVSSNSEELVDGIKLLLARFGIFASKKKDRKQFWLTIPYKYAPIFSQKIGSSVEKKGVMLQKLALVAGKLLKSKSQDYTDMVCGFGDVLHTAAKKLRYPTRRVNNFTKRQKIGRTTLLRYINTFTKISKEKNVDISKEITLMERMYNSDVVWDEIVRIEYAPPTTPYVYDLTVNDAHTFATFDGLITHNTMRTFHYAGVAEHVPTGLPRLIELVDVRKEPKKPTIDIYLKKEFSRKREIAEKVAHQVESITVEQIAKVKEQMSEKVVKITYDEKLGKSYRVTFDQMVKALEGMRKRVDKRSKTITVIAEEKKHKGGVLRTVRKTYETVKKTIVKGVAGITRAVVVKDENGEYFVRASGSNIEGVLKNSYVDPLRIYTNNVKEIERIYGIEAGRAALVREMKQVMDMQKLAVDIRHIMLVADGMCSEGKIVNIGRHGLSGKKPGVLARAAFEETVKHLVNAAAKGEEDKLVGVTENIIVGQTVPIGTGNVMLEFSTTKPKK